MRRGDGAAGPGSVLDRAGGHARNLAVPAGFNDSELDFLIETAVPPLVADFAPEAIYVQGGCDALADDPQSKLGLSNGAIWRAVAAVAAVAPRLVVTGGGGYNPYAVGRCWAGLWATLSGREVQRKPRHEGSNLRDVVWHHRLGRTAPEHWFETLSDVPRPGPIRAEIEALAEAALVP